MKKIEKLNEKFYGLSPEYNQLVAFQDKINEIIDHLNINMKKKMKSITFVDEKGEPIGREIRGITTYMNKRYIITERGIFTEISNKRFSIIRN